MPWRSQQSRRRSRRLAIETGWPPAMLTVPASETYGMRSAPTSRDQRLELGQVDVALERDASDCGSWASSMMTSTKVPPASSWCRRVVVKYMLPGTWSPGLMSIWLMRMLGAAALVGGDEVAVAVVALDGLLEVVEVAAAGVGLVAQHHAGPLPVAHGRGAASRSAGRCRRPRSAAGTCCSRPRRWRRSRVGRWSSVIGSTILIFHGSAQRAAAVLLAHGVERFVVGHVGSLGAESCGAGAAPPGGRGRQTAPPCAAPGRVASHSWWSRSISSGPASGCSRRKPVCLTQRPDPKGPRSHTPADPHHLRIVGRHEAMVATGAWSRARKTPAGRSRPAFCRALDVRRGYMPGGGRPGLGIGLSELIVGSLLLRGQADQSPP